MASSHTTYPAPNDLEKLNAYLELPNTKAQYALQIELRNTEPSSYVFNTSNP